MSLDPRTLNLESWAEFRFRSDQNPIKLALQAFPELRNLRASMPELLTVKTTSEARPNSLSRKVGKGYQPPHTDQAHFGRPPTFVMLWSMTTRPQQTKTHVRRFEKSRLDDHFLHKFGRSVWSVKTNSGRFHYTKCLHSDGSVQWDSACFKRCLNEDLNSDDVDRWLSELPSEEISWEPLKVLIFNNKTVLHGRCDANNVGNTDRQLFRVYWHEQ